MRNKKCPVIGVTGSIAAGKSTAVQYLVDKYHAVLIDADKVGHEVLDDRKMRRQLTNRFGKDILDRLGRISRKKLGAIVFADPAGLRDLNSLTHPEICRRIYERTEAIRQEGMAPVVFIEAIELLRSPLKDMIDEVWVVWADDEVRLNRVMLRQNLTREEAEARLNAQFPQEELKAAADRLIDGGLPLEEEYRLLDRMMDDILADICPLCDEERESELEESK